MIRSASPGIYISGVVRGSVAHPRRADGPLGFLAFYRHRLRGTISPAAVDALATAITNQEGFYPGSVSYRNNNPGNLIYAGQPGAAPGAGGFASFSTLAQGKAALANQITLDATRGADVNGNPVIDLSDLITSWAPPSQNDTAAYIASVAEQTGYDPTAPLSSLGSGAVASSADFALSSFSNIDTSNLTSSTVDLSGVGLPANVPTLAVIGGAVAGLLLLSRL